MRVLFQTLFYLFFTSVLSFSSQAQTSVKKVPTQDDIIKKGALRYFQRLPSEGWERLLHLAKMGSYDLFLHQHRTKPQASPFRIFHSTVLRRLPSLEWGLAMRNNDDEYEEIIETNYGLCAGLTMVTRKLQLLAHFDPANNEKQAVPLETNRDAWFHFMKHKIDDMISQNKMTIVPGFKNINEFTAHPYLQKYFKEHIIRQWELVNINFLQGLFQGLGGTIKKMTQPTLVQNINFLEQQLSLGINPIVFLASPHQKLFNAFDKWVHVVQVVKINRLPDKIAIQIWDPNVDNPKDSGIVNIYPNGQIYFYENDDFEIQYPNLFKRELAGLYPLKWDTYEIADMIEKNLPFCIARPGFCTTKPEEQKPPQNPQGFQSRRTKI